MTSSRVSDIAGYEPDCIHSNKHYNLLWLIMMYVYSTFNLVRFNVSAYLRRMLECTCTLFCPCGLLHSVTCCRWLFFVYAMRGCNGRTSASRVLTARIGSACASDSRFCASPFAFVTCFCVSLVSMDTLKKPTKPIETVKYTETDNC